MVPTLNGRIQTRIFMLIVVGVPWTLLISLVAPRRAGADLGGVYKATFWVLAEVLVVGCVLWEPLYHSLMQFRWEKDWPVMFILLEGIPEGILAYVLLRTVGPMHHSPSVTTGTFLVDFIPLWILIWLTVMGPMRVLTHRWRFRGGRLI